MWSGVVVVAMVLGLVGSDLAAWTSAARAATLDVCLSGCAYSTVQSALDAASDGDIITIGAGVYTESLSVTTPVTLAGAGRDATYLDGGGSTRTMIVAPGVALEIKDLTVRNGRLYATSLPTPDGAGILNEGDLTVRRVDVVDNYAADGGGGIYTTGPLTVIDSTIARNQAMTDGTGFIGGGGIAAVGSAAVVVVANSSITTNWAVTPGTDQRGGGGIAAKQGSDVIVSNSTIAGNASGYSAGGIYVEGSGTTLQVLDSIVASNRNGTDPARASARGGGLGIRSSASAKIVGSTISGNIATGGGGGIQVDSSVTIENSTISGNSAGGTGGGISASGRASLASVTVVGNTAQFGGGIYTPVASPAAVSNSIIAGNTATTDGPDCYGSLDVSDVALVETVDGFCTIPAAGRVITGVSPLLGPLQDNGGLTPTHLPADGSPVIDAGATTLMVDQRGLSRPSGSAPDIGSVEVQGAVVAQAEVVPNWAGVDTRVLVRSLPVDGSSCGWLPTEPVEIRWDDAVPLRLVTADADGCVSAVVLLDSSEQLSGAPFGPHKIILRGQASAVEAQAAFELVEPQLHVFPFSVAPGSPVSISGCGWNPNAPVNVFWLDSGAQIAGTLADAAGCIDDLARLPQDTEGYHRIGADPGPVAPDGPGGSTAALVDMRGASFTMDPVHGPPGEHVDLAGCNWFPGETVDFYWIDTNALLATFPTDPSGCLTSTVTDSNGVPQVFVQIPSGVATGDHQIGARGNTSGQRLQRTFTVTEAGLILDPVEGVPGTVVAASGCGWEGNAWVNLEWQAQEAGGQSGDHPYLGAAPVDPVTGCFGDAGSFTFAVPDNTVAGQSVTVLATGDVSGQAAADFYAIHDGTIFIPDTQVAFGDTFTVEIHGAIIGESVTLEWSEYRNITLGTFPATTRDFAVQVDVPAEGRVGPHDIIAAGDRGFDSSASVELLDTSTLEVSPNPLSAGMTFELSGTNWRAGSYIQSKLLTLSGEDIEWLVFNEKAGADGSFSYTVDLPQVPNGTYVVAAWNGGSRAETQVVVEDPTVSVDPARVTPGTSVTVTGEDWLPGELVTFGLLPTTPGASETQLAAFGFADANGVLQASVNMPNRMDDGTYGLVAHGLPHHDAIGSFWVGERTVAVTVTEVNLLGTALDGDVAPGDLYPSFRVDAPGFDPKTITLRDQHTNDVLVADTAWTADFTVPSSAPLVIPVEISLFDWDSGSDPSSETQADVSPDPTSLSVTIPISLVDGTWPGAPTDQGCFQGDQGGLAVRMCVATSVVSSSGDIDDDGLWDAWEIHGVDQNGDSVPELDLPAMGASPCRKTIGVDYASMETRDPLPNSLAAVVTAFDSAPISAPAVCGIPGETAQGGIELLFSKVAEHPFKETYTCPELIAQRAVDQSEIRERLFHYAMFANRREGTSSIGVACRGTGAVIIALGDYPGDSFLRQILESSTVMHEIGHTLNLWHGGFEDLNHKPNYLSVMNYRFASWGQLSSDGSMWILDYSHSTNRELDERALTESAITTQDRQTAWVGPDHETVIWASADAHVDWNDDGPTPTDEPYVQDINGDGWCVGPGPDGVLDTTAASDSDDELSSFEGEDRIAPGEDGICDTEVDSATDDKQINKPGYDTLRVLKGFNDWANIELRARDHGRGEGVSLYGPPEHNDLSPAELLAQAHQWLSPQFTADASVPQGHRGDVVKVSGSVDDPNGDPVTLTASLGSVELGAEGGWTWTHTITEPPGRHTVTLTADDGNDGSTHATLAFEVLEAPPVVSAPDSASVQYSDMIDPVAVTVTDPDSAPGSMDLQATGLPAGLSLGSLSCVPSGAGSSCSATLEGTVSAAPGTYDVVLTAGDGIVTRTAEVEIVVLPENAALRFHGGNPVALKVDSGGDSAPFEIMVKVDEADPDLAGGTPAPGDLTRATTSIRLIPIGSGSPIDPTECDRRIDGSGYDQELTVVCRYDHVPVDAYAMSAEVGGSFQASAEDVLVVYDPASGFAQGAGTFIWPGTDDMVRFGFSLSYNKKGTNVRGGLMMVRTTASGEHYVVKSNALYGLALSDPRASTGWASIAGKATYDAPDMAEPEGNHEFVVYAEDGASDRFWIEVHDKDGSVIASSSMARPGADWAVMLDTGDIVVPHGDGGRSIN